MFKVKLDARPEVLEELTNLGELSAPASENYQVLQGVTDEEILGALTEVLDNGFRSNSVADQTVVQLGLSRLADKLEVPGLDPGVIDGELGSKARAAITQLQSYQNIPVTGEVSQEVLGALVVEFLPDAAVEDRVTQPGPIRKLDPVLALRIRLESEAVPAPTTFAVTGIFAQKLLGTYEEPPPLLNPIPEPSPIETTVLKPLGGDGATVVASKE